MAKNHAIGGLLLVDGYDLSGDTQTMSAQVVQALMDITGINAAARERLAGLRDGSMSLASYFNDATDQAHDRYKSLPTTAMSLLFATGSTLGTSRYAAISALQTGYDANRGADGSLMFNVQGQGAQYGIDMGELLTAGKRTDTSATNGTSVDYSASTSFGWVMWYHLLAFSGTSVTIKIQDSADNSTFADLSEATSGALTAIGAGRVQAASATATARRYQRVATSGTFSNAVFVVGFSKFAALTL